MIPSLFALGLTAAYAHAASVCNGHAELCDRSYSNVTFLGAHDSYAIGSSLAADQTSSITQQLTDGLRTLQLQTHNQADGIHVCHSSCSLLDGGSLESYLANVTSWVESNPNDVITLVMTNPESLPVTQFESAFSSSGLQKYTYSPPSAGMDIGSWPTLGSMIDAGTTVVVFMDYHADFSSVPWIMDEFQSMFEDAYDVTDTTWGCAANRSQSAPSSSLLMINHFLDVTYNLAGTSLFIPDKDALNTTNSDSSLGIHVGNCMSLWGRHPNHILLDFYNSNGIEPFDYVAQLNSVPAPTNSVNSASVPTTSNSGNAQISSSPQDSKKTDGSAGTKAELGNMWITAGVTGLGVVAGAMGIWL